MVSGGATVQDAIGLDRQLAQADLLITGEGSLDRQSLMGKGVGALIHKAQSRHIPILVVAGQVDPNLAEELQRQGIASASLVAQSGSIVLAMQNPRHWIPKVLYSLFADPL
ncbi:MAG: glycerate kinase [Synechococcaceae cyanobacterium SM2_3_2]|nr:glycerate kinase [Synechococcaceae cyanobacterium SM2_3_2]